MMRNGKIDFFAAIPKDLYQYSLLPFLTAKEMKKTLSVCQFWKETNEDILKKTTSQQFYAIGNAIVLYQRHHDPYYIVLRKNIAPRELIDAFPKKGNVKLFSTENDALNYCRSLETDCPLKQNAIYKVQFLKVIPEEKQQLTIDLNHKILLIAVKPRAPVTIHFFETNVGNIIPISGSLKTLYLNGRTQEHVTATFGKDFSSRSDTPGKAPK